MKLSLPRKSSISASLAVSETRCFHAVLDGGGFDVTSFEEADTKDYYKSIYRKIKFAAPKSNSKEFF